MDSLTVNLQGSMFLATLLQWYTCSGSLHHAASGAQSWHKPRSSKMKCTIRDAKNILIQIYCGLTVPKQMLIIWPKIPKMPKNLSARHIFTSPKVLDFNEKKLHWASVVRGLRQESLVTLSCHGILVSWVFDKRKIHTSIYYIF